MAVYSKHDISCFVSTGQFMLQKPLPGSPVHKHCVCTVCAEIDMRGGTETITLQGHEVSKDVALYHAAV